MNKTNIYGLDDYLSIHLSKRCNLKCPHCYQTTYQSQVVSVDDVKKAVNIFSPKWLVLYGGEPMIEQKTIRQIIDTFPDKKYLIYTNGTIWNKDIFERMDKIVVTIESFIYEEAIKYRKMSKEQHDKSIKLVRAYKNKCEILHNIYPTSHDKLFYCMARLLDVKVQSYPIILNSSEFKFNESVLESNIFHYMKPNRFPKMRLLEDGTLTRDMRGIYNLCHVNEWNNSYEDISLPISDKCLNCKYLNYCPASSIFPHFVYDILKVQENPHFCKMTEAVYGR